MTWGPWLRTRAPRGRGRGAALLGWSAVAATFLLGGPGPARAAGWQSVPVPLPAGASSATLNAVTCAHANLCWAVGTVAIPHHGDRPLADRWNGRRWQGEPVPPPAAPGNSGLFGVACSGPAACLAVGSTAAGHGGTLAERWNGRAWSRVPAPSPAGSSLSAISCPSAAECLAVGNSGTFESNDILNYSLNLRWNGTTWTREPYGETGFLNGVSCPSTVFCAGVGNLATSAGDNSVTERWNGTRITDVPSGDGHGGELEGVSCVSAAFCIAVGSTNDDSVALWNGRRWSFRHSPGELDAVSCLRTNLCVAAGGRERVARWDGRRWAVEPVPRISGTTLNAVTCSGPATCLAVGAVGPRALALRDG